MRCPDWHRSIRLTCIGTLYKSWVGAANLMLFGFCLLLLACCNQCSAAQPGVLLSHTDARVVGNVTGVTGVTGVKSVMGVTTVTGVTGVMNVATVKACAGCAVGTFAPADTFAPPAGTFALPTGTTKCFQCTHNNKNGMAGTFTTTIGAAKMCADCKAGVFTASTPSLRIARPRSTRSGLYIMLDRLLSIQPLSDEFWISRYNAGHYNE